MSDVEVGKKSTATFCDAYQNLCAANYRGISGDVGCSGLLSCTIH